jgi:hypothetical protein
LYNAVYQCLGKDPGNSPLVFDDSDQAIQDYLKTLYTDVVSEGLIADSIDSLLVELSAFSRNS